MPEGLLGVGNDPYGQVGRVGVTSGYCGSGSCPTSFEPPEYPGRLGDGAGQWERAFEGPLQPPSVPHTFWIGSEAGPLRESPPVPKLPFGELFDEGLAGWNRTEGLASRCGRKLWAIIGNSP